MSAELVDGAARQRHGCWAAYPYLLKIINRSIAALLGIVTIALVQPATIAAEVKGSQASAAAKFLSAGVSKYKSGDNQGALADYDRAIQLNPRYALASVNRGVVRSALRDPRGAIADFDYLRYATRTGDRDRSQLCPSLQ